MVETSNSHEKITQQPEQRKQASGVQDLLKKVQQVSNIAEKKRIYDAWMEEQLN